MAIPYYLAMTSAEMAAAASLPKRAAWMACHFSPYSTGLANLPQELPKGSMLILNDRTPIHGHDPQRIAGELQQVIHQFSCCGLLLDFQNTGCPEAAALAESLEKHMDCPIGISAEYCTGSAAVFLPAIPTDTPAEAWLKPWKDREIWLEMALEGQTISLTQQGAKFGDNIDFSYTPVHSDSRLHCRYSILEAENAVIFHTWRTAEDLAALMGKAESLGVTTGIGLYQELGQTYTDS